MKSIKKIIDNIKYSFKLYNILPTIILVIFIIIVISNSEDKTAGDIIIQFSPLIITILQIIYQSILRIFIKFDLFRNIKELLLVGAIIFLLIILYFQVLYAYHHYVLKWY